MKLKLILTIVLLIYWFAGCTKTADRILDNKPMLPGTNATIYFDKDSYNVNNYRIDKGWILFSPVDDSSIIITAPLTNIKLIKVYR